MWQENEMDWHNGFMAPLEETDRAQMRQHQGKAVRVFLRDGRAAALLMPGGELLGYVRSAAVERALEAGGAVYGRLDENFNEPMVIGTTREPQ